MNIADHWELVAVIVFVLLLGGLGGWGVHHVEQIRTNGHRQVEIEEVVRESLGLAMEGARQSLINSADGKVIASWEWDICHPNVPVEPQEVVLQRLRDDVNGCELALRGIDLSVSAESPTEVAKANTARVEAERCMTNTRTTQLMLVQYLVKAARCEVSPVTGKFVFRAEEYPVHKRAL